MSDTVLQVENITSRLVTTDTRLKESLAGMLRFRPKNYFHNIAYKKKKWDGWKYFFDAKSGVFMTGLLPEVTKYLRHINKEYVTLDERPPFTWQYTDIGQDFLDPWVPPDLKGTFKELHDFQPDLVNIAIRHGRGIIQAPTGAGKTYMMISLMKCLPPKTPTLFVTKNAQLVHQNWKDMKLWGIENLGRWYDKYKEPNYVMCVTNHVDTFESIQKLLPKFKALIVDEVHDCLSDVPVRAYKKMKACQIRLGISATPFKYDKKKIDQVHKWSLKGHFGPIFQREEGQLTTKELQERGILAKSDCTFYPIDKPDLTHEPYAEAVKLGIEQNFHYHDIVARLAKKCTGRTLIVVERVEQGEYLRQLIPGSTFIQGKVKIKDREPIMEALTKGDRTVAIVMRQIITAGINVKVHDLINAAGGDAAHNTIQLIGRGLRPANDKEALRYHDFLFSNSSYLRDHSVWRIEVFRKEGHKVTIKESIDF